MPRSPRVVHITLGADRRAWRNKSQIRLVTEEIFMYPGADVEKSITSTTFSCRSTKSYSYEP